MSDVAVLAGVSHQTVSRVLNDHPSVRPETRERVLAAIAELGYRRNSAARALVTRRSGALGVVATSSAHHGPASTLLGLERAAREVGYFLSVATIDRFDAGTLRGALDHFLDQAVEGIAVIAPQVDVADALAEFAAPVPVVTVTSGGVVAGAGAGRVVSVGVDQRAGARDATRHLLDLGHREVLHLAGPQDWFDARERLAGWREADAGAPDPVVVDWEAESGYREGLRLVDAGLPSAVLAANDQVALGLLRAFWERGVRVPDDVSVVGFDDVAGSAFFVPPLTTVRQDFPALGRSAIDALVRVIGGEEVAPTLLPASLVVRGSSGVPR
ncbi:LacI family DNA-binding transcriptional regulator [Cellulomonas triticagri]|uniref:LacI family DNA-binding transcriptional regulator n=2 Tax=Cellulomonas triticagri TaxID=2483352 RepID=A0A3M2J7C1_9CELL|nr:LacI family DNA-binding transcriptional regulator [Cellulomonas triticagri]RMI09349.1 LacI family DNA-binding transcriptional regulator [Cellulomonas triticagri]